MIPAQTSFTAYTVDDRANITVLSGRRSGRLSQAATSTELPRDFTLPAQDLGRYSGRQLLEIANGQRTNTPQTVIAAGNENAGFFVRRNLFIEPGRLNTGAGFIEAPFVVNPAYYINGQPPTGSTTSADGRFPINGQLYLNSQFRPLFLPPNPSSGLPFGQYPINSSDPVASQFSNFFPSVEARGAVDREAPYVISSGEFRNGRFTASLGFAQIAQAELSPIEFQADNLTSTSRGQILVNGQNTFVGTFRPTVAGSPDLRFNTQQGNVLIEGRYNGLGEYQVGDTVLKNGTNVITGLALLGTALAPVTVQVNGRYTSGGQYVIQSQVLNTPSRTLNFSNERENERVSLLNNPEVPEFLSSLPKLLADVLVQAYSPGSSPSFSRRSLRSESTGLYLSFIA